MAKGVGPSSKDVEVYVCVREGETEEEIEGGMQGRTETTEGRSGVGWDHREGKVVSAIRWRSRSEWGRSGSFSRCVESSGAERERDPNKKRFAGERGESHERTARMKG